MAKGLILFIHGLGGDGAGTWGDFPTYIANDPRLAGYDARFFEYRTALLGLKFWTRAFWTNVGTNFSKIQKLADALRTDIDNHYPDHRPIVLVAHSLGGLIARQYVVDAIMGERPLRVSKMLLYAVPNTGAGVASVAQHLSFRQQQLKQLCKDADITDLLNKAWQNLRVMDKVRVRFVIAENDGVVDEPSARLFPGNPDVDVVLNRGHRDLVKPKSSDDRAFEILRRFTLAEDPKAPAVATKSGGHLPYRVVAFDLDGTLIRGFTFSWTAVWKHLGYAEDTYKGGMRKYLRGEWTYSEWCTWAVGMFQLKGLRRDQFKEIVKSATLTNNLEKALGILRAQKFTVALISGGIDTVLYEMIPNADQLFDYISINRFKYDAAGVVSGVDATAYDFAGKAVALEELCKSRGYELSQSVFVGDGFNDAHVASSAGLSIAYPPSDYETEAASHVLIREDDLMQVVEKVIGATVN